MADENLNPLGWDWGEPLPDKPFPALLNASCIPLSTVVLAREACDEAGGFDESPARRGIEDYDLWLRVAARRRLAFLDEVVAIYRQHERSVTALEGFLHPALIAYYESLDERIPGWRILAPGFPLRRKLAELHVRIGRLALEREGGGGEARRHLRAALRLSPLVVLRMGRRLVSHALLGDRLGRAIGGWREERRKAKGINRDDFK